MNVREKKKVLLVDAQCIQNIKWKSLQIILDLFSFLRYAVETFVEDEILI